MPPVLTSRKAIETAIACVIACEKAYNVAGVCVRYGLSPENGDDPMRSKAKYVEKRLASLEQLNLLALARRVVADYGGAAGFEAVVDDLKEALRLEEGARSISEITRRRVGRALDELAPEGDIGGHRLLDRFLETACPWLGPLVDAECGSLLASNLRQHMIRNRDWDGEYLFEQLGVYNWSDDRFLALLAGLLHPLSRQGEEQARWHDALDQLLAVDGFTLVATEVISGHPVFVGRRRAVGVPGRPKNLIFASSGAKPVLVFSDAVNNDVEIVENAELCLIYDDPFPEGVFTWEHLATWWSRTTGSEPGAAAERSLYLRLQASVRASRSPPEELLFRSYYAMRPTRPGLPALLPQVYLHYDPASARSLGGERRLLRQRMDFLLLLGSGQRIVIEVDGRQHYSDEAGNGSPQRYADMVAEDRRLRLGGYEVYRFGGAELQNDQRDAYRVREFFESLFERHSVPT